ncbi:phosphoadenylyl-sulfate reductase [Thalassorhabdomicrobium marinisediminis]|uniref:phosphoadenylyl-sulfate reductase n=1 Tax=Thalassorhabdomicrobium marinisediminis TaxID=2170577 RepID=UPI00248F8A5F|nr:phosphoadenylyl-sulfate reductase [Thalassorhabdomicrobium marinisediminis]
MPLDGRTQTLNRIYRDRSAVDVVDVALNTLGQIAVVSSFGAESVVLLHLAAQIDRTVPVLFIDTEMLFPETLAYQREVAEALGLTNIQIIRAKREVVFERDNENLLHLHDPDACCALRKTEPLQKALRGYDAWLSGRKRFQGGARAALDLFEVDRPMGQLPRIKVNPLAHWDSADLRSYIERHRLPRHPLVARGYPSIGCMPCTSRVGAGEDARAGRWRDQGKTECGIHFAGGTAQRAV